MKYKIELVKDGKRYEWIKNNFGFENTIFIGDGISDAPIIRDCLFGIAPANARIEAKRWARYVTPSRSAEGAVCDACIKRNNKDLLKKLKNIYNGDIIFAEDFARFAI